MDIKSKLQEIIDRDYIDILDIKSDLIYLLGEIDDED